MCWGLSDPLYGGGSVGELDDENQNATCSEARRSS